jgi:hypothetical protein
MIPSHEVARLTPEQFKALAKFKGWKFRMLAERWNVTPEWISNISRDPKRDIRYDDALIGLPNLNKLARDMKSRNRQVELAMQRNRYQTSKRVTASVTPGYRYKGYLGIGSIVTACTEVGSLAEEGMRGIVFQIQDNGRQQNYGVIFETGLWDWFTPDYVDSLLAGTGMVDSTSEAYVFVDEMQLQKDFEARAFQFWPNIS